MHKYKNYIYIHLDIFTLKLLNRSCYVVRCQSPHIHKNVGSVVTADGVIPRINLFYWKQQIQILSKLDHRK